MRTQPRNVLCPQTDSRVQTDSPLQRKAELYQPTPASRFRQISPPVLLMNLPISLSTDIPNNAWMEDMNASEREVYVDKATAQFFGLYSYIAQSAIIYLLPSTPGLQDQPYVSNLGVVLPHCENDTVVIS